MTAPQAPRSATGDAELLKLAERMENWLPAEADPIGPLHAAGMAFAYKDAAKAIRAALAPAAGDAVVGWIEAEPGTRGHELIDGGWMARSTLMHMGGPTPRKRKPENELFPLTLAAAPTPAEARGVGGVVPAIQRALNELKPPKMTETRAEYWKAGVRAAIGAINAALAANKPDTRQAQAQGSEAALSASPAWRGETKRLEGLVYALRCMARDAKHIDTDDDGTSTLIPRLCSGFASDFLTDAADRLEGKR